MRSSLFSSALMLGLTLINPVLTQAQTVTPYTERKDVQDWITSASKKYQVPAEFIRDTLAQAKYSNTVAKAILPPSNPKVRSWSTYRARFLDQKRINQGALFWAKHAQHLEQVSKKTGVPPEIIVAIIGVETMYGEYMGSFRVIDALSTLGFDYPAGAKRDRSEFFKDELGHFFAFSKANNIDPASVKGSYAGAIGLPQFMPGSERRHAVDGDGDSKIDLANNPKDAISSVANFLINHGWQTQQPIFVVASLPAEAQHLVDGGLEPTLSWTQLSQAGAKSLGRDTSWQNLKLGVIDLYDGKTDKTEYRLAAPNFFVITKYNNSYFYATSVADLAQAIVNKRYSN